MFSKALLTTVVCAFVASVHAQACTGPVYTVVTGDSCFTIGQQFGVTAAAIIAANPGVNAGCTNLIPGQGLCIPL
ncbi:hypothetical protein AGABI2DRAFT_135732 [Agaricus bisporus var. bisporus H97]|uniref:hypothetical protein n=1 Tax=Agaricus bisporus var. bisporus (strain H97 / ATCC MYA-4626 / FGSC 10389) TaxID=936046 RepID=UPI00029F7045|nr:hypothetical protein AGABI2DRAFT_135732 [Agaricus bisporus var. bisporus H97]EKV48718.1 hypothetical protein AGABI2DRAFT_135732 [Agaricus bisporus var. bisporus H97]